MGIVANVSGQIAALQAQITSAGPLSSVSQATITAIQLNAATLVSTISAAVTSAAGELDTWTAPTDPDAIVSGIMALKCSAAEQATLVNQGGYVGRMNKNLDQLV